MPLPKPVGKKAPKTKKKAAMSAAMHELSHGPANSPARKATSGAARQKQNVAIALKQSGQAKPKIAATPDKPNGRKRKRPRNKGRT